MKVGIIILSAGLGTRMKSKLNKVLHKVANLPLINHVINVAIKLNPFKVIVISGEHNDKEIKDSIFPIKTIIQSTPTGTASAALTSKGHFKSLKNSTIIILNGDTPLIKDKSLKELIETRKKSKSTISLLAVRMSNPKGYGRLILDNDLNVQAIREEKDASTEEKKIDLCYSGIMAVDSNVLFNLLSKVDNKNAKNEYYLTSIIEIANSQKCKINYTTINEEEVIGCDSKQDLANAEKIWQTNKRTEVLNSGTFMQSPETVFFSTDTKIGTDVTIEPNVYFGKGVEIENDVTIRSFSYLEDCKIKSESIIGPYARIRPGSIIGKKSKIGNFVEIKNSTLDEKTNINHLSYIGDSSVGKNVNIGAGTITCNYDGFKKESSKINDGVFIGSNSALIAPIEIGENAIVGAGSVVTQDVPKDSLVIARANQDNIPDAAKVFRKKKQD